MKTRKLYCLSFLLVAIGVASAQNFSKVQKASSEKDWQKAHSEFMNLKSKDKKNKLFNKAEANYWFGQILTQAGIADATLSSSDISKSEYIDKGFEYLKKAYELNKNLPQFILTGGAPYKPFFDIYIYYFQQGIEMHNEAKYQEAVLTYEKVNQLNTFLSSNNIGATTALDTNLVFYTTLSYINLEEEEKAYENISTLVTAKAKKDEMKNLLKWALVRTTQKQQKEQFETLKSLANTNYPEDKATLWNLYEEEYLLSSASSYENKMKAYEDVVFKQQTKNTRHLRNYAVEVYKHNSDMDILKSFSDKHAKELFNKLEQVADRTYSIDQTQYEPMYLHQKLLYRYVSARKSATSDIKQKLREKAAPVKGVAPKGSKLEKELNALKSQIATSNKKVVIWAEGGLSLSKKLVDHFASIDVSDKKLRRTYMDILDIASGLAYDAKKNDLSDKYDKKLTSLASH